MRLWWQEIRINEMCTDAFGDSVGVKGPAKCAAGLVKDDSNDMQLNSCWCNIGLYHNGSIYEAERFCMASHL